LSFIVTHLWATVGVVFFWPRGGGGTCSWFTCSFECPVRFRTYLFVILMISSSTNSILESLWRVFLLTYHGALNTILSHICFNVLHFFANNILTLYSYVRMTNNVHTLFTSFVSIILSSTCFEQTILSS
jgi:hypothetical protein